MTRDEAIEILNRDDDEMRKGYFCINDFLAIEILKQKPKTDVLEQIKAEIESLSNANPSYWHTCDVVEREDVLDIIDKYKAESEG